MPSLTTQESNNIDQEIEQFLDQVSGQYIAEMGKDGVWGGDLECGAIANILKVKILVHKDDKNNTPKMIGEQDAPNTIKLLLKGEDSGNGHYSVINNNNDITTIVGDGNCLFNACVTAYQEKSLTTTPSITTGNQLRKAVCEYLKKEQVPLINSTEITTTEETAAINKQIKESDSIRARFATLIHCEDSDFEDSKKALPNIPLREQAIELRQKLKNKKPLIEETKQNIFTKYQENIQKNTRLNNNITTNAHQDTIQIYDTKNEQQLLATIKQDAIECPILPNTNNLIIEQQQLFIEFLKTQVGLNNDSTEPLTVEANNFTPPDLEVLKKLLTEQNIKIKLKLSGTNDYIYQPPNNHSSNRPK